MVDISSFYRETLHLLDNELIDTLTAASNVLVAKRGEKIQNTGDIITHVNFLKSGVYRVFFKDIKGHDITDSFGYMPGHVVLSCMNFDIPAQSSIEALEDSTFISVDAGVISELLQNHIEILNLYNHLLRRSLKEHINKQIVLARCSSSERYKWFTENYPELAGRLDSKYISSFLNISPVSLSLVKLSDSMKQDSAV